MSDPHDTVQVKVTLSHPLIPTHTSEQVYMRIDVSAPTPEPPTAGGQVAGAARPPLDLALVLDRSGSMHGEKLAYAKDAVLGLIDRLRADDHLSLTAYDDRVDQVFPRCPLDALVMKATTATIEARGSTNLSAGLVAGLQQLPARGATLRRVLLLSDGLTNDGVTDPAGLADLARRGLASGRTVSTFGVGQDFAEDTLRGIADAGGGNYYFIASAEDIPSIFQEELGELGTVVAQNLTVHFTPTAAEVIDVLGFDGRTLPVQAGDVQAGATRSVILALRLPPTAPGDLVLGDVICRWTPLETPLEPREARLEVSVLAVDDLTRIEDALCHDVLRAAGLQFAADANKAAVDAARRGDEALFHMQLDVAEAALHTLGGDLHAPAREQSAFIEKMRLQGVGTSGTDRDLHLTTDWTRYKHRRSK
jgi:Ca-activated chloride channel family protein